MATYNFTTGVGYFAINGVPVPKNTVKPLYRKNPVDSTIDQVTLINIYSGEPELQWVDFSTLRNNGVVFANLAAFQAWQSANCYSATDGSGGDASAANQVSIGNAAHTDALAIKASVDANKTSTDGVTTGITGFKNANHTDIINLGQAIVNAETSAHNDHIDEYNQLQAINASDGQTAAILSQLLQVFYGELLDDPNNPAIRTIVGLLTDINSGIAGLTPAAPPDKWNVDRENTDDSGAAYDLADAKVTLYGFDFVAAPTLSVASYMKLYDWAPHDGIDNPMDEGTPPAPVMTLGVPSFKTNEGINGVRFNAGISFTTGLFIRVVAGYADTDTTPIIGTLIYNALYV